MVLLALENQHKKNYVDDEFNDPSIIKNTSNIDLKDKFIANVGFIEVNHLPEFGDQLTSKLYVDKVIKKSLGESTLLKLDPDEKLNLDEQDCILPNSTLMSPKTIMKLPNKYYVDKKFINPSIIKNTAHVDFTHKNLDNIRFIKVTGMPAVEEHLAAKYYIDQPIYQSVDESALLRLDTDYNLKLNGKDSIILNSTLTSAKIIIESPTKSYVDSLHENSRNRRELPSVFNDQDNEFDNNKLTNSDSVSVIRSPTSDDDLSNEKICW